jgi:hypothetical protein
MNKLSINFSPFAKSISSFSGLKIFDDLVQKFEIKNLVGIHLPEKERSRGFSSWNKFYAIILGFIAGFDCLDDFDWFGKDPLFLKLTNSPSSITLGNFLRCYKLRKVELLQELLPTLGWSVRKILEPNIHKVILTMDSSDHRQYGVKSEGVDFGYQKFPCLNSQNIFDDKGICYGFKLRKGNTHSAADAPEMLYNALKIIPKNVKKQFRADSAYSNSEIYNVCLNQNCNFVICLKENVWSSVLTKNRRHIKWQKTRLQFFDSESCEIGSCLYPLKGLATGRGFLRVVFIRTLRLNPTKEDKHPYHYYAVVTDMSESEMSHEHILKFYRKRSQVENNIKDIKNGMDFHHFPCMSLKANNVWGIIGVIAYNLMRYASFAVVPGKGCFVKTTRKKLVTIAGEVISHARSIEIRVMNYFFKEVEAIRKRMNFVVVDENRLRSKKSYDSKT